jgi:hypothetical protein
MTPAEQKIDTLWRGLLTQSPEHRALNYVKLARYLLVEFQSSTNDLPAQSDAVDHLLELDETGRLLTGIVKSLIEKIPKESVPGEFIKEIERNSQETEMAIAEKQRLSTDYKTLIESRPRYEQALADLSTLKQTIQEVEKLKSSFTQDQLREFCLKAIEQQKALDESFKQIQLDIDKQTKLQLQALQRRRKEDEVIQQAMAEIPPLGRNVPIEELDAIIKFLRTASQSLVEVEKILVELTEKVNMQP